MTYTGGVLPDDDLTDEDREIIRRQCARVFDWWAAGVGRGVYVQASMERLVTALRGVTVDYFPRWRQDNSHVIAPTIRRMSPQ